MGIPGRTVDRPFGIPFLRWTGGQVRILRMAIEIEDTTEFLDPMDLAEFICTDEHPILSKANAEELKMCNKWEHAGQDCNTIHSDVVRILSASVYHV